MSWYLPTGNASFLLGCFQDFSFFISEFMKFNYSVSWCGFFWVYPVLRCWIFWICAFVSFPTFREFSAITFLGSLSAPFLSPFFMEMWWDECWIFIVISQVTGALLIFFFSLYSLYCSNYIDPIGLFWSSLILILCNLQPVSFFFVIVPFICITSIWFFFITSISSRRFFSVISREFTIYHGVFL